MRKETDAKFTELAHNAEHASLAYGIDWRWSEESEDEEEGVLRLASCSFYDHLLTVWTART